MTEAEVLPEVEQPKPQEDLQVTDLDQFVNLLMAWHSNRVSRLEHMLEIPEGVTMEMNGEAPVKLEGPMLYGFKAGIICALHELGNLPFAVSRSLPAEDPQSELVLEGGEGKSAQPTPPEANG